MKIVTGETTPILRTVCKPVEVFDDALKNLARETEETMLAEDPETEVKGVGLAAPQVGIDARMMLVTLNVGTQKKHKVIAMVNPEIVELSDKTVEMEEGCLSLPGVFEKIRRSSKVRARWQNLDGNWCEKKFSAWDARIFLHEYDHLEGVLLTDYLKPSGEKK